MPQVWTYFLGQATELFFIGDVSLLSRLKKPLVFRHTSVTGSSEAG